MVSLLIFERTAERIILQAPVVVGVRACVFVSFLENQNVVFTCKAVASCFLLLLCWFRLLLCTTCTIPDGRSRSDNPWAGLRSYKYGLLMKALMIEKNFSFCLRVNKEFLNKYMANNDKMVLNTITQAVYFGGDADPRRYAF